MNAASAVLAMQTSPQTVRPHAERALSAGTSIALERYVALTNGASHERV